MLCKLLPYHLTCHIFALEIEKEQTVWLFDSSRFMDYLFNNLSLLLEYVDRKFNLI